MQNNKKHFIMDCNIFTCSMYHKNITLNILHRNFHDFNLKLPINDQKSYNINIPFLSVLYFKITIYSFIKMPKIYVDNLFKA